MANQPHLQFMDRAELQSILQEHGGQDLVAQADGDVKEYFDLLRCPECGSSVIPFVNPKDPFSPGALTPNFLGRCTACGSEFSPKSGVISKRGKDQFYDDPRDPTTGV